MNRIRIATLARALVLTALLAPALAACGGRFAHDAAPVAERGTSAVHRHVLDGTWHFENDRIGLALAEFRTALRHDPQSVRALNGVAASYDRLNRFDLAEHYYQLALAVEPESAQTLNNLAYSHMLRGDEASADRYLAAARSAADTAPDPWRRTLSNNADWLNSGAVAAVPRTLAEADADDERVRAETAGRPRDLLAGSPVAVVAEQQARRGWIERHGEKVAVLVVSRLDRLEQRLRGTPGGPEVLSYFPEIAQVGEDALVEAWDSSPFLAVLEEQRPIGVAEGPLPESVPMPASGPGGDPVRRSDPPPSPPAQQLVEAGFSLANPEFN